MTVLAGLSHVSLSVRDLEVSELWYRKLFGLELLYEELQPHFDAVTLVHPPTGTIIVLIRHLMGSTARFDETRIGLDHLALAVPDRQALEAWEQQLSAAGIEHSPVTEVGYGWSLVFRDPDHIQLELFCFEGPGGRRDPPPDGQRRR